MGELIRSLYPYLMRYGHQQIDVMDRQKLSTLRKLADGISEIVEGENAS